jgi:hypothetical protein
MIPTVTTSVGLEWARGRLDTVARIADHVADVTRISDEAGSLQFVVDPKRVNSHLIRQTRPTSRGSSRKLEPPYNPDERRFIDLVDEITTKTVEELRDAPSPDSWAFLSGASVFFTGGTIPQFLGLEAGKTMLKVLSRTKTPAPESFVYENFIDDRLGAGLVTALRVYLRQERLGPERADLIPHRHHVVDGNGIIGSLT